MLLHKFTLNWYSGKCSFSVALGKYRDSILNQDRIASFRTLSNSLTTNNPNASRYIVRAICNFVEWTMNIKAMCVFVRLYYKKPTVPLHLVITSLSSWLLPQSRVVTVCTTRLNIHKFYSAHTVYLCVFYGSQIKQRLFPCTASTDWVS